ncbi:threonine--tRNA ligase [Candidatus Woesearchaeota archaeon]|nr:threonine--tRNA ligase [Candidatus Woesearchaeota archaeon]
MKILAIHADFIEFEAKKKAMKQAEEGIAEGKQRITECLVVYSAVEKRDEEKPDAVVQRYVKEIEDIANQVKTKTIVLYPYAHLSSQLSSPAVAEKIMKDTEKILQGKKYQVTRAPFGWYKSFTISCKGHPLSELSREFSSEEATNLKKESKDQPFEFDTKKQLTKEEKIRLSAAALIAKAVKEQFREAFIGSIGFHHDQAYVDIAHFSWKPDYSIRLEKRITELVKQNIPFAPQGKKELLDSYQQEIAQDLGKNASIYTLGDLTLTSLFKDPFVKSTKELAAIKILSAGSAYWKNNEKNQQLTRVYCVAFSTPVELEAYQKKIVEAENRSHLKIGKEQGLFVVSELVGPGLPLLAPKGMTIRTEIVNFLWDLHKNVGYQRVAIPHIAKDLLYKKSGHWEKFGDELFHVKGKYESFVLKPMNCPHHIQIFNAFSYSYRNMPIRYFEPTTVYRDEKPGQLVGLSRVRSITQDDGHIFCRVSQIKEEVRTIVGIVLQFYKTLGMDKDYWVSLSIRGEDHSKYLGTQEVWAIAESSLEAAAKENKLPYKKMPGEAAFYGPKLDFIFKDSLQREWQLATIQLDFNLPNRFELHYMNEKGEKEQPVMIHRAISGSLERFLSILIEHFAGKFPLWLSPVQVKILTVTDRSNEFAKQVYNKLKQKDIRVELNDAAETIGKKIRDAQLEQVNYIVTIGDKEIEKKVLAVRTRTGEVTFDVKVDDFISQLEKEIKGKVIS